MKSPEEYRGREQTYLKHFFLERYLERVAYIIGYYAPEFAYVDGFSGPWRAEGEDYSDTSFMIALEKLRKVKEGLAQAGKAPRIRCLFIEKSRQRYQQLRQATERINDLEVHTIHGELENSTDAILQWVGKAFALFFVDPTGWTGIGLQRLAPILRHPNCEVIINFMFDFINRFLDVQDVDATMTELFGGAGWNRAIASGEGREERMLELYQERVQRIGQFRYATRTRILKPTKDRSYFYLVYATRHPKGIEVFRAVEKLFISEQERVRAAAKQNERIKKTGQMELFGPDDLEHGFFEQDRDLCLARTELDLLEWLEDKKRVPMREVFEEFLQRPLVWKSDIQEIAGRLRGAGRLEVEGLGPNERTVKEDHILFWRPPTGAA